LRLFEFEDDNITLQTEHDFKGYDFVWYDNPIDHFDLYEVQHRVLSFEQLRYYAEVLFYLNPDIDFGLFQGIFRHIGSRDSGKSIRTYSKPRVDQMIEEVYKFQKHPYCRRMRRVIFNPQVIISTEEKLAVTSHVVKRGITYTEFDIRQTVEKLFDRQQVITQDNIAKEMMCSRSTVVRLMNGMIKDIIDKKNEITRREIMISKCIELIDVLSDSGSPMKMQELKNMTSIRDYSVIREAVSRYESGF
jgi:predicted DNA-binding protein (UPF0251 family)